MLALVDAHQTALSLLEMAQAAADRGDSLVVGSSVHLIGELRRRYRARLGGCDAALINDIDHIAAAIDRIWQEHVFATRLQLQITGGTVGEA